MMHRFALCSIAFACLFICQADEVQDSSVFKQADSLLSHANIDWDEVVAVHYKAVINEEVNDGVTGKTMPHGNLRQRHLQADTTNNTATFAPTAGIVNSNPKIIGGRNVKNSGVFKFFSSISTGNAICGATLVKPDVVLTAANCKPIFRQGKSIIVDAYKLRSTGGGGKLAKITKVVEHPSYRPGVNDLMLLHITPNITGYKLVNINMQSSQPSATDQMKIIGFGATSNTTSSSTILQWAPVPSVPEDQCKVFYGNKIKPQHICIKYNQPIHEACNGDNGGPLLLTNTLQVGIMSFGTTPCTDAPSVYTRTSYFGSWLKNEICRLTKFKTDGSIKC